MGIKLDMAVALAVAAEVEFVEHNAFTPRVATAQADTEPEWTLLTGTTAGIQQTNARWYAAKVTGYTGVRWSTLPVALVSNDNYMYVEAIGAFNGSGDYFGPALRMASDQTSFYAFLVTGNSLYAIRRAFEGVWADEKSGSLAAPIAAGDVVRIEVKVMK